MAAFRLTTYGRREWLACTAATALLLVGVGWLAWSVHPLLAAAGAPLLAAWGWAMWFFRDPERPTPGEPGLLLSSADGIVADITPIGAGELLGRPGVRIGVFMNVFDVHVNRAPCDAEVVGTHYTPGTFLDVRHPDAAFRNEAATTRLAVDHGGERHTVAVRQIAGLIARRIVTDLAPGQKVRRGQRMGMIKFGSRVELWVPAELVGRICVGVGERTLAGRTVLVATPDRTDRT